MLDPKELAASVDEGVQLYQPSRVRHQPSIGPAPGQNRVVLLGAGLPRSYMTANGPVSKGDVRVAQAAWVSTFRELTADRKGRIWAFLASLLALGHHTPLERGIVDVLVCVDEATAVQLLKHRIGVSVNSESARYKELKDDKAYIPFDWTPAQREALRRRYDEAYSAYHKLVEELVASGMTRSRAKESARYVLPKGNQLWLDVQFNLRSLLHFMRLRDTPHAQAEIRQLAQRIFDLVDASEAFPVIVPLMRRYLKMERGFSAFMAKFDLTDSSHDDQEPHFTCSWGSPDAH